MTTLQEKIKTLPELEFPDNLHGKIMRSIYLRRAFTPFLLVTILLFVNTLFLAWRIEVKAEEMNSLSIIKATLDGFEMSADFFANLLDNVSEFAPLPSILVFLVNTVVLGYALTLFFKMQNIKLQRSKDILLPQNQP